MRRKFLAVLLVPTLFALSACGDDEGGGEPAAESTSIDGVSIGGEYGEKPAFEVSEALTIDDTEVETLIEGDGPVVESGDTVTVDYIGVVAGSDEPWDSSWDRGTPATFTLESGPNNLLSGIVEALEGQHEGSRVVAAVPPEDGFGAEGNSQFGIQSDSILVFVFDIIKQPEVNTTDLSGVTVTGEFGDDPEVEFEPALSVEETEIKTLSEGDGATVKETDRVKINYRGVNGRTGEEFDSSWTNGQPATFGLDEVVPGFTKAIAGQTVGSRVLAAIPPKDGYGTAGSPPDILGTDTLIFVIDIIEVVEPEEQPTQSQPTEGQ